MYTLVVRERFRLNLCFSLTQKRNLSLTTKVYILEKNLFINFFPHSHPLTGRTWCGGLPTSCWPWWSPPSSSCPRPRPRPSWSPQGHHEVGRSPHQVHSVRDWLCWEKLIKRFFSKMYTLVVRERLWLNLWCSLIGSWVGVLCKLKKEDFTKAIMKWGDRHTKCVQLEGDYVEKSY